MPNDLTLKDSISEFLRGTPCKLDINKLRSEFFLECIEGQAKDDAKLRDLLSRTAAFKWLGLNQPYEHMNVVDLAQYWAHGGVPGDVMVVVYHQA